MAEEKPKDEEKDQDNSKKRKKPLIPSLSNCHSCGRHFSVKSLQTLTDFHTLNSQWRIVLLCSDCLRLVRSAANCSYCFSPIAENSFLDCRQCCFRVHAGCVPRQRRLFSPSDLDPETFACVDCCPLPRFRGGRPPGFSVSRVPAEEFDAVTRQENPVTRSEDDVAKDEELALQLHLEMNGSRRISRCCQVKGKSKNGGAVVDKGFLDSSVLPEEPSSFVRKEAEKEEEITCGKGNNVATVLKYYCRRAAKLNGGMVLGKTGRSDKLDRYLMKYKRKSKLKPMMNQKENQVAPNLQITCSTGCQT